MTSEQLIARNKDQFLGLLICCLILVVISVGLKLHENSMLNPTQTFAEEMVEIENQQALENIGEAYQEFYDNLEAMDDFKKIKEESIAEIKNVYEYFIPIEMEIHYDSTIHNNQMITIGPRDLPEYSVNIFKVENLDYIEDSDDVQYFDVVVPEDIEIYQDAFYGFMAQNEYYRAILTQQSHWLRMEDNTYSYSFYRPYEWEKIDFSATLIVYVYHVNRNDRESMYSDIRDFYDFIIETDLFDSEIIDETFEIGVMLTDNDDFIPNTDALIYEFKRDHESQIEYFISQIDEFIDSYGGDSDG